MIYSKKLENRINRIHERVIRLVYNNSLNVEEFLVEGKNVSILQNNPQILVIFIPKKHGNIMKANLAYPITFDTESILSRLAPKIWKLFPVPLVNEIWLNNFKKNNQNMSN